MTINGEKVHAMLDFIEVALIALPWQPGYFMRFDIKGAPDSTEEAVLNVDKPMKDTLSYGSSFILEEWWHIFSSEPRHPYDEKSITAKPSC